MEKMIETRGAKPKYYFVSMEVGERREWPGAKTQSLLNCAKRYALNNGHDWKFRCFSTKSGAAIVRVK